MEEERLGEEVDGGGGKEVEKGKGEGRSGEEREPGGGETEEVEGQRRWRKEGRGVCVPIYLQDLISFLQHSMLSHWTLGMHILNHVMDAPCGEQNRLAMIKLAKVRGYDQVSQGTSL